VAPPAQKETGQASDENGHSGGHGLRAGRAGAGAAAAAGCKGWTGSEPSPGLAGAATVALVSACDVWVADGSAIYHWTAERPGLPGGGFQLVYPAASGH